jgi:hypothetical protein
LRKPERTAPLADGLVGLTRKRIMIEITQRNVGRIAERIVANELEARGFRVSDLNSDGTAANADLLAVSPNQTLQIQVKGAANAPKDYWWVGYGYCTDQILADKKEPMFNRRKSFYTAQVVILVAVRSPKEYSCIVLPVDAAEKAAQLHLDLTYRTPTRAGQPRKPHKTHVTLEPSLRARDGGARLADERAILAEYRDEQGWERLLAI